MKANTYVRKIGRWVGCALVAFITLLLLLPGIVYLVALDRVDGRPTPANPSGYGEEAINASWVGCYEHLPLRVEATNPWNYVGRFIYGDPLRTTPGERAAWRVAATHNSNHPLESGFWWHPSGAALTIWITRNWSAEQIGATLVRDDLCKR